MFMWLALISQTPGVCMSPWLASLARWVLFPRSMWLQAAQYLQGRVSLDLRGTWGVILLCGDWSVRRQLACVTVCLAVDCVIHPQALLCPRVG